MPPKSEITSRIQCRRCGKHRMWNRLSKRSRPSRAPAGQDWYGWETPESCKRDDCYQYQERPDA